MAERHYWSYASDMSSRVLFLLTFCFAACASAQDFSPGSWRNQLPQEDAVPQVGPVVVREPAAAGAPQAERFDSYMLALTWMPQFCAMKQTPECSKITPQTWEGQNLSLHGLWPNKDNDAQHNFGYCGVPQEIRSLDRRDTWCQLPKFGLSPAGLETLSTYMPGTDSCLQNHEWYKHGTCTGMAADGYFALAAGLTAKFAATAPGRFITANVGRTVSAKDFVAAFEEEFGPGSQRFAGAKCVRMNGKDSLAEVRLNFEPSLQNPEELAKKLKPSGGSCPASFVILAPRPR